MVANHQPGQSVSRSILPEDMDWMPFPAARSSPGYHGRPSQRTRSLCDQGQGTRRHKTNAAQNPEDRIYTVISGVFYIGLGEQFDGDKVNAYPPGSVVVLPGDTAHFHWAKSGEHVTQVTAIGPVGLHYLNPADDPRQ
jgi:hypothetical protein